MAGATVPIRAEADLVEAAKAEGARMSRSTAQQLNHWARLGKELEASHSLRKADIDSVLAGEASYDDLPAFGQAIARTRLWARSEELRSQLNLAEEFVAAGKGWVEADDDGNVYVAGVSGAPGGRVRIEEYTGEPGDCPGAGGQD